MMTLQELKKFYEEVENAPTWDTVEVEDYKKALESVGLDYSEYDDPDKMWADFEEKLHALEAKKVSSEVWDSSEVIEGCEEGLFIIYQGKKATVYFNDEDIKKYLKKEIKDIDEWSDEDVATVYGRKEEEVCKYFIESQIDRIKYELNL